MRTLRGGAFAAGVLLTATQYRLIGPGHTTLHATLTALHARRQGTQTLGTLTQHAPRYRMRTQLMVWAQ